MRAFTSHLVAAVCGAALVSADWASDVALIKHTGESVGETRTYQGLSLYVSMPAATISDKVGTAVVYLTDVFGVQLEQNRLLADSFARAGYLTVAPDLFNGTPAPTDLNTGGFNTATFIAAHGVDVIDPIIANAIKYLRTELGVKKIALTGYCFGGKYALRFLAPGKGGDVAFAAHPSLLEDAEIAAITGPVALALAENDSLLSPARRSEVEALLQKTSQPYQVNLYSGTSHGFGVRANVSDPEQKFGKESAFLQAARWFDFWASPF